MHFQECPWEHGWACLSPQQPHHTSVEPRKPGERRMLRVAVPAAGPSGKWTVMPLKPCTCWDTASCCPQWPDWLLQGRVKHYQGSPHSALPCSSCFDKSILNILFFFLVCVPIFTIFMTEESWTNQSFRRVYIGGWKLFNYFSFIFLFFYKQSYISKWESSSSRKVEKFSSENIIMGYFVNKTFFFMKTKPL